jgi:predicted outer membrane repeat protein
VRGEIRYHISLAKGLCLTTHGRVSKMSVGFFFFLLVFCMVMLLAPAVWSKTIHVPRHSSTIQVGIDGAVDGDTVLVADGVYTGQGNKNLDFLGKAIVVRSENGPEVTVIDCENDGRGFHFHNSEGSDSQVEGFTIRKGWQQFGSGITCGLLSSPTIANCIIINNTAAEQGGGIACNGSSPTIANCTIAANTAGMGGGIDITSSSPNIVNCTIEENEANWGGGIELFCSSPVITNCTITDNTVSIDGGGIDCFTSYPVITCCVITRNTALNNGGSVYCLDSSPVLNSCTITKNTASVDGGGIYCSSSSPAINSCILWGDSPEEIDYRWGGGPIITYTNVQGGWFGEGNIDEDPLFRDPDNGDYHLMATYCGDPYDSPCIDAGDPSILDDSLDCWHGLGTSRSDMGAYGGSNAGWPTAVEGEESEVETLPKDFVLFQNYPNPFNSETRLYWLRVMGRLVSTESYGIHQVFPPGFTLPG